LSQISSWNLTRLALVALPVLSALGLAIGVGVIGAFSVGYSHVSEFMSALGASGAPLAKWANYAVFIPAELWLLLFLATLAIHLPHSRSKWFFVAVLAAYAILLILLAILPCDAGCHIDSENDASETSFHILHMTIAAIAYPIAFIGLLPLSLKAPSNTYLNGLALPVTAVGFGLICAIVLVPDAQGLFQRLIEALIYIQLIFIGWYASSLQISAEQ
jgi:hypothetical protein